ncbi:group I intron-associated PD-(D/E)XK endonuclease [Halobaculum marinum]|uniref:Group I intron-associated PD-(D/E)XK endonuclease n=1 Tax=Halobaculum marinum TaxID=3031996 RepID=A0ABD5WX53_9EURY|nr:group I intron-associated PD-(D/E)XK endonuclease [Halobaculum sp. DT55]
MDERQDRFEQLETTEKRGQASEAILKAAFLTRGIPVLTPEYDNEPYDFVIDLSGTFHRIQAKTAYRGKPETVQFETVRTRTRSEGYDREGYAGEVEFFAVYDPIHDDAYLVDVDDAPRGKMEIRREPTSNGQRVGVNWFEDLLLDTVLSTVGEREETTCRRPDNAAGEGP